MTGPQPGAQFGRGQWFAEPIIRPEISAGFAQKVTLFFGFHAFCDDLDPQFVRQHDVGLPQRKVTGVAGHLEVE